MSSHPRSSSAPSAPSVSISATSKRTTDRQVQGALQLLRTGAADSVVLDLTEYALETAGQVRPNPDGCELELIRVIHHGSTCAQSTRWDNAAQAFLQLLAHIDECPRYSQEEKAAHKLCTRLLATFVLNLHGQNRMFAGRSHREIYSEESAK